MSRLTKKYAGGYGLIKVKDNEQAIESTYPNTLKAILECFGRLGEIEDILCAPDGTEGVSFDRLREICAAERDGRCVVLPGKVGDTVYKIWYTPCHKGNDYPDGMDCCGCLDECDIKRAVIPFTLNSVKHIVGMMESLNQFWYLTREAAEAAISAPGQEGEGRE